MYAIAIDGEPQESYRTRAFREIFSEEILDDLEMWSVLPGNVRRSDVCSKPCCKTGVGFWCMADIC